MTSLPLISICIPSYKNVGYLNRLLESISIQTYRDFEVIITDDSNDRSVSDYINTKKWDFSISYFKNEVALGSPENWNAAISYSRGQWIKIMHHDDWFNSPIALEIFVQEIKKHTKCNFFFCTYKNVDEEGKVKKAIKPNNLLRKLIFNNPIALLSSNIIGPPSVTIYKNVKILYDKRLKWLVDIDFYVRYLKNENLFYIDQSLINIGIHKEQVTKYSFLKPEIEIPEHLHVLQKLGESCLRNVLVYDAFWRLVRNLKIESVQQFSSFNKDNVAISDKLIKIINHQKYLPAALLGFGPFSKAAMLLSYSLNRLK